MWPSRHGPTAILGVIAPIYAVLHLTSAQPLPRLQGVLDTSCGRAYSPSWHDCVGVVRYPNGNVYRGEFHHGMREGFGVIAVNARGRSDDHNIRATEPSIYIGQFRDDRLNGHGVWFTAAGVGYSGSFVNNIPQSDVSQRNCNGAPSAAWTDCVAILRYGHGNVYRGEFVQGQKDGIGLLEIQATDVPDANDISIPLQGAYVGQFRGGRPNGRGVIIVPDARLLRDLH